MEKSKILLPEVLHNESENIFPDFTKSERFSFDELILNFKLIIKYFDKYQNLVEFYSEFLKSEQDSLDKNEVNFMVRQYAKGFEKFLSSFYRKEDIRNINIFKNDILRIIDIVNNLKSNVNNFIVNMNNVDKELLNNVYIDWILKCIDEKYKLIY